MWRMRVLHATGFAYPSPATASYNEARLTPRSDSRQNVILNRIETVPATRSYRYVDYWGTLCIKRIREILWSSLVRC